MVAELEGPGEVQAGLRLREAGGAARAAVRAGGLPEVPGEGVAGMRFCPKCATPLEPEERARAAAAEAMTRHEITELRKLVERSPNPPASGGGPGSSRGQTS